MAGYHPYFGFPEHTAGHYIDGIDLYDPRNTCFCDVAGCSEEPRYLCGYTSSKRGEVSRLLCEEHAKQFDRRHGLGILNEYIDPEDLFDNEEVDPEFEALPRY